MKFRSLLLAFAMASLAACQQETQQDGTTAAPDAKPGLTLDNGRLVLPAVKGNPGAIYFTLSNSGKDKAVLAAASLTEAKTVELHQTEGGTMKKVDRLEIGPGSKLDLKPGATHAMAFDLDPNLAPQSKAELTLTFEDGDKLSALLTVEARGGETEHMH